MTEFDAVVSVRLKDPDSEETLSRSFKVKELTAESISDPALLLTALDTAKIMVETDTPDPGQAKLPEGD